eukprot:2304-Heterococcus_DN1.PRE.1
MALLYSQPLAAAKKHSLTPHLIPMRQWAVALADIYPIVRTLTLTPAAQCCSATHAVLTQIVVLVKELDNGMAEKAQLGLGHSYSRSKASHSY